MIASTADAPPIVRLMPDDLANQIAAGEVVERPASAVKELVENALDAGATRVRVTLEDGGLSLIRVADDGRGMVPADAAACVQRHATSKLLDAADLFRIRTLGFRGEALPSIASVSRFTLITKPHGRLGGTRVHIEGGAPPVVEECGSPPGTEVTVRDLFFNTPARLKFLKTRGTEVRSVLEALQRLALAWPQVGFWLEHNGRKMLDLPAVQDAFERVAGVVGPDDAKHLYALPPTEVDGVTVSGWFGQPELQVRSSESLRAFVNGRFIRDRTVQTAFRQAYEDTIDRGRWPVGVLLLQVPPHAVDVNVHPMKTEVRFHDSNTIFRAVMRATRAGLVASPWVGDNGLRPVSQPLHSGVMPADTPQAPAAQQMPLPMRSYTLRSVSADQLQPVDPAAIVPARPPARDYAARPGWSTGAPMPVLPARSAALGAGGELGRTTSSGALVRGEEAPLPRPGFFSALHFVGQIHGVYLLAQDAEGLVIIDQHAAHERITYERLRATYEGQRPVVQPMLLPQVVRLDSLRGAALDENLAFFADLGFEIEPLGDDDFGVRAVPAMLGRANLENLLRDALDELMDTGRSMRIDQARQAVLVRMACHRSVRAGQVLNPVEVQALFEQLDEVPFGGNCPHGRPVWFRMGLAELETRFGRR